MPFGLPKNKIQIEDLQENILNFASYWIQVIEVISPWALQIPPLCDLPCRHGPRHPEPCAPARLESILSSQKKERLCWPGHCRVVGPRHRWRNLDATSLTQTRGEAKKREKCSKLRKSECIKRPPD